MFLRIIASMLAVLSLFVFIARRTISTVKVEHTFNTNSEKLWKLWSDSESMKNWWGPKDFTAPVIKNDFRVNGSFLLSMKSPQGEVFWNTGTYKEIIPGKKIVSTMSFSDENGKMIPGAEVKVPGVWPDEVSVLVEFSEVNGKTQVTIQETGIPLIMKLMAKMGWEQQFEKIDHLLLQGSN